MDAITKKPLKDDKILEHEKSRGNNASRRSNPLKIETNPKDSERCGPTFLNKDGGPSYTHWGLRLV